MTSETSVAPGPRTGAGAYLRATATNGRAELPGSPADYATRLLWYTAFELIVRRRFTPDSPVADIARSVVNAGRRHPPVALAQLEAEMLVRAALGEDVPIEDIDPRRIVVAHVVLFGSLADELALTDDELGALIVAAEHLAEAQKGYGADSTP